MNPRRRNVLGTPFLAQVVSKRTLDIGQKKKRKKKKALELSVAGIQFQATFRTSCLLFLLLQV